MTELKTLKDLDVGLKSERVIISRIKAEAIKRIKMGNNRLDQFCDITEEDLK